jgi:alkanesulfonate monooxygenase SsuD/methylene tetrahydromethanopterin reductase-like flavin-dependent oxidoreductase (luciferase family)
MRFDGNVYYHGLEPGYPVDVMIDEWREQAKFMDAAGFTSVWLGEQHFWYDDKPISASPNPVLTGMDLAAHTKRIRVAQSACVLPDYHPIRLAEDIALLDQSTKGRLDVGVARGTNSATSIQFSVSADRRDQARNWRLFAETLEILIKAWTQETFSHRGEFYTVPNPGWIQPDPRIVAANPGTYSPEGELLRLGVMPKPYQKPHPPIWQAADSTDSYVFAAEHDLSVMCFARSVPGLKEAWSAYQAAASKKAGREVPFGRTADGRTLAIMRLTHVTETHEEAQALGPGIGEYFSYIAGVNPNWARKGFLAKDEPLTDEDAAMDWFGFLQKHDIIWVGTAEEVAEKVDRVRRELNCGHVTVWPNPVAVPFGGVMRSFDLWASRVMPQIEKTEPAAAGVGSQVRAPGFRL